MRGDLTIDDVRSAVVRMLELIAEVAPAGIAEEMVRKFGISGEPAVDGAVPSLPPR